MRIIPLDKILVPEGGIRQEFNPVAGVELMNSIQLVGLLHPLLVMQSGEQVTLVAGRRRAKAIKDIWALGGVYTFEGSPLPSGLVPTLELGELTELAAVQAEFDENDQRENITWQERAAATMRLAALRGAQAASRGEPAPTVAELAKERRGSSEGYSQEATRRELIVAKNFANPVIAGAKTLDDAYKALKQEEEVGKRVELAKRVGTTFSAADHRLFNADSREWLLGSEPEVYDVILVDPPYGIDADKFGDSGIMKMQPHSYSDSEDTFRAIMGTFVPESFRAAKTQAHLYCFCDIDWFTFLRTEFLLAGWSVHRTPLIWHKPNGSRAPWPEHGPQRKWEMILYAIKGKRTTLQLAGDVLTFSNEPGMQHGAQKPVELYRELLKRSARPGDRVLDCFCGTGTIFPAAHSLKVSAVGVEQEPATYALAMERLEKLKGDNK